MAKKTASNEAGKKKVGTESAGSLSPSKSAASEATGTESGAAKRSRGRARAKSASKAASRASARSKPEAPAAKATAAASKTGAKRPGTASASRGKRTAAKTKDGDGQASKRPRRLRKTRLKPQELDEFRQMLIAKRRELMGDVTHLETEAMRQGNAGGAGVSSMPIHMADLGSDTWEQELTLGLIENERGLLREIDEALYRIENKTYGICLATNKPITKSRLRAQPWAKYCIEYARKRELGLA